MFVGARRRRRILSRRAQVLSNEGEGQKRGGKKVRSHGLYRGRNGGEEAFFHIMEARVTGTVDHTKITKSQEKTPDHPMKKRGEVPFSILSGK